MNKYIDAEKLIAEIDRLKSILADPLCSQGNILGPDWVAGGNKMLNEISSIITSLQQEQPEVDLKKEIDNVVTDYSFTKTIDPGAFKPALDYAKIARHFYELGLNARKEK